jgi:hypothetical protein
MSELLVWVQLLSSAASIDMESSADAEVVVPDLLIHWTSLPSTIASIGE